MTMNEYNIPNWILKKRSMWGDVCITKERNRKLGVDNIVPVAWRVWKMYNFHKVGLWANRLQKQVRVSCITSPVFGLTILKAPKVDLGK